MLRIYPNEEFKEVVLDWPQRKRYAVSNKGRLASFTERIEDGDILKGGNSDGYITLRYFERNGWEKTKKPTQICLQTHRRTFYS